MEFLNQPKKEAGKSPVSMVGEHIPQPLQNKTETQNDLQDDHKKVIEKKGTGIAANPVAPAIQPPEGIRHPGNGRNTEKKESDQAKDDAPVPTSNAKQWGRRMDYRTAVVKSGGTSTTLSPVAASNIPPTPYMPGTSKTGLHSAGGTAQQPAAPPEQKTAVIQAAELKKTDSFTRADAEVRNPVEMPVSEPPKPAVVPTARDVKKEAAAPIRNPLPVPKKHVAKEMDFDLQPISTLMHFDVVDMSGIDYFDIN